jgi:hypothetical protein
MSIKDLIKEVGELSPDERKVLKDLLFKDEPTKPKRQRKRKKNKNKAKQPLATGPTQERPINTSTRRSTRTKRHKPHMSGTAQARVEPINTTQERENLFLTQRQKMAPVTEEERLAIKIDKKVARKHTPMLRDRPSDLMEVQCTECDNWFDVSPKEVRHDTVSGEVRYICNKCEVNRRR